MTARRPERPVAIAESEPLPPEDRVVAPVPGEIERLYRTHRAGLLHFVRARTSGDMAGDLVQQVFLRLFRLGSRHQAAIADPARYLRRAAANVAADHAKGERRRAAGLHVPVDDVDLYAPDQLAALEARDMLQRLELAMQRLKPRTREIFLAHRIDGYSYVEIAAMTGLSVKSIEKHMSRAIAFVDRVLSSR